MKAFEKVSAKQKKVIRALLENPTRRDAARAAGVSEATIWRMFQEENFREAYRQASTRTLDAAIGALQAGSNEAIETLREIMADDEAHTAARVTAARTILEMGLRCRELIEHEERIAELEQRIEAMNSTQKLRAVK